MARSEVLVDLDALKASVGKLRLLTVAAERGQVDLHSAYKCQQFLREAVGGDVWAGTSPTPATIPDWMLPEGGDRG
jgi:phosphoglycolate phosphatase-like HAD superfamily hydrolase